MQWNTSVRAEPSRAEHSATLIPRKLTRMPSRCVLAGGAAQRGLLWLSGLALQLWVADVDEEHLLSSMNAEVTLSEEAIAKR